MRRFAETIGVSTRHLVGGVIRWKFFVTQSTLPNQLNANGGAMRTKIATVLSIVCVLPA